VLAEARRVLLVRLRSLGDAVMMTPVPTALKAWRPDLHLAVLVEEPLGAVFRRHPAVDEVISVPAHESPLRRIRSIRRIRRERFDVVFGMHSGSTAGLYTALSAARLRVAYARARFARLGDVQVPSPSLLWKTSRVHTVQDQLAPLLHLGIPVPQEIHLVLSVDPEARRRVQDEMGKRGLPPGRFVVLQPFSRWPTKEWAPARFAELARRLTRSQGVPVVVLPAPSERPKLERLLALAPEIVGLTGVGLEEMMAWIEQCGLFVGNDGGALHVAAALGKKLVALWGSSDPQVWRPWSAETRVLSADLPCLGCPGDRCYVFDSPRCIESPSVEQAVEAVAQLRPF
jgi:lipopolysaccharide heptosyltransferase III